VGEKSVRKGEREGEGDNLSWWSHLVATHKGAGDKRITTKKKKK